MNGSERSWLVESEVPAEVRGDYAIVAAEHVRAQEPFLYTGFCFGVPCAILMGADNPPILRFGLSLLIFVACLVGIFLRRPIPTTERGALRSLFVSTVVAATIVGLGAVWAILSWQYAPPGVRLGFPFFMMLGVLVTGYAFAMVRRLSATLLAIGILPMAAVLTVRGTIIEQACALGLMVAGAFMYIMARNNRAFLVELLENRRRLHDLSRLDSLTGLPNRRALLEDADRIGLRTDRLRLILLDIDHFKTINDEHGHDMGDRVLCRIAEVIAEYGSDKVSAGRIGGEEFALVGCETDLLHEVAGELLDRLRQADMPHRRTLTASIGVAIGPIKTGEDWRLLYARADKALYAAKARGRDCAVSAPPE